jgi:hypothetical protein
MEFQLPIQVKPVKEQVHYRGPVMLTGSCFTEHIGNRLQDAKFRVMQNPNGILFDPASVTASLESYVDNPPCTEGDLFFLNELWQSWQHHGVYSNTDQQACLQHINHTRNAAHNFLKTATHLIVTLGSSFSYRLHAQPELGSFGRPVANCHRAPQQWFHNHLMEIDETTGLLENCIRKLLRYNPGLTFIFTVSPVRHIRDGVVDNNRSKARLIESVHRLAATFDQVYYFPAYELVIDVLRDYRFFDIDMVHPNYPATEFVMEHFVNACIREEERPVMEQVKKMVMAARHRSLQPSTNAHRQFLEAHHRKTLELVDRYPFLDMAEELKYFKQSS